MSNNQVAWTICGLVYVLAMVVASVQASRLQRVMTERHAPQQQNTVVFDV